MIKLQEGTWEEDQFNTCDTQELSVAAALMRLCAHGFFGPMFVAPKRIVVKMYIQAPDVYLDLEFTGTEPEMAPLLKALAVLQELQRMTPSERFMNMMSFLPGCKERTKVARALGCGPSIHDEALEVLTVSIAIRGDNLTEEDLLVATELRHYGGDDFTTVLELAYETGQSFLEVEEGVRPRRSLDQVVKQKF